MYYRLNVFPIAVPPLRDRGTDILLLANSFLVRHAWKHSIDEISFSKNCEKAIESHGWPGNVRELENTIHRGVLLATDGEINPDALQLKSILPTNNSQEHLKTEAMGLVGKTVADVERSLIFDTLDHCLGNRTHAANILGISIRTLRNKLKLYSENSPKIGLREDKN